MRPWEYVDSATVPETDNLLTLVCRGNEYTIEVDGRELMGSGPHGSEEALSDLACDRLPDLENARILVGGLGMGFTLAAALRRIGAGGTVVVAELSEAVVRWNEQYLGKYADYPLRDPRTKVYVGDVADLVEHPPEPWSAILLDVDNGPDALTREYNGWLYTRKGLSAARDALIEEGILAIWSAAGSSALTRKLRKEKYDVEVVSYVEDERPTPFNDGLHVIWLARRPVALGASTG